MPSRYDLNVNRNIDNHDVEPNAPATGRGFPRGLHWLASFGLGL